MWLLGLLPAGVRLLQTLEGIGLAVKQLSGKMTVGLTSVRTANNVRHLLVRALHVIVDARPLPPTA